MIESRGVQNISSCRYMETCPTSISSPLKGPDPIIELKATRFGLAGSVIVKNCASDEKVLPPKLGANAAGRKKTPLRKMLNELKNENRSKFAPIVYVWLPRKNETLFVSCQT